MHTPLLIYLQTFINISLRLETSLIVRQFQSDDNIKELIHGRAASLTLNALSYSYLILILTHLKLWVATATHNFKWVKITRICLML